jgi:hypothetical protein
MEVNCTRACTHLLIVAIGGGRSPLGRLRRVVSNESDAIRWTDRLACNWEGKLLDKAEAAASKAVATPIQRRPFRLRMTGTGSVQVSLNRS